MPPVNGYDALGFLVIVLWLCYGEEVLAWLRRGRS